MKKALVLMLAVLLLGTVGMARIDIITDLIVVDTATFAGATIADLGTVTTCNIDGGEITGITDLTIADGGTGSSTASAARTALGVEIGANVQAWDAQLDDIAALVQSDSYIIVGDDSNWVQETGATARASLGLTIGTNVQAYDDELTDIAGLTFADDYMIIGTGAGTIGTISCTVFAQSILDDADAATVLGTLDTGLADLATVTMAANEFYYTSADNTHQTASVTVFARTVLDDADASTIRTTLGLAIDSDVQAHSADLDTIASAATTATNEGVVFISQFSIAYTQTASYTVCTVPANADVTKVEVVTTTAFTDGSATTIDIGWSGTLEGYASDLAIRTAGFVTGDEYANIGDVGGSNRDVLAQITTDDSAGACTVYVYWTMGTPGTP